MKTQKKLRRLSFDLMQSEMSVINNESILRGIVGRYRDDCFWRCISYLESNGSSYSESAAASYADAHFGPEAGLYYYGAGISNGQMKNYISQCYGDDSF